MLKEFVIRLYMLYILLVSYSLSMFSVKKNKIIIFATFTENNEYILSALNEIKNNKPQIILVYLRKLDNDFNHSVISRKFSVKNVNILNPIILFHLVTSEKVIADNYIALFSKISFKSQTECIQIWHANGAIKKFGLADHSLEKRSSRAYRRFKQVYSSFDKVVVGSDEMGSIFQKAYGFKEAQLLKFGMPRTDFFFDLEKIKLVIEDRDIIPSDGRKVILYAPTFRDNELDNFQLKLNLDKLYKALSEKYILVLRLHPSIKRHTLKNTKIYPGFVYDLSHYKYINHLLVKTDILISDYSSIPFEFALFKRPMIFYAYDLKEYEQGRGLWYDYKKLVPGPVVFHTEAIINSIENELFDMKKIEAFSASWNKYNDGAASQRLARYLTRSNTMDSKMQISQF